MWNQQVSEHPAWSELDALDHVVKDADAKWPDDAEVRELIARVAWFTERSRVRGKSVDPRGITLSSLNTVQSAAAGVQTSLANVASNQAGYVAQGHAHIDNGVQAVSQWSSLPKGADTSAARAAAEAYREEVEKLLADVQPKVSALEESAIQYQLDVADSALKMEEAVTEYKHSLAELTNRVDEQVGHNVEAFGVAQSERRAEFQGLAQSIVDRSKRQRDSDRDAARQQREGDHEAARTVLTSLVDLEGQARKTLESMGVEATTSYYHQYAAVERKAANRWSWLTVALGIFAAIALFVMLWGFQNDENPSWSLISLKSLLGVVFLAVAGYAGKEASGHRSEERQAKQRELAISALGPFLAKVPEEDTKDLRVALAGLLFTDTSATPVSAELNPVLAAVNALRSKKESGDSDGED